MTKASDNAFPSILITEGTEPSAPAAGKQRLYIDSTTHLFKATNSSGTDRTIEGVPAGAVTSSGLTMATARLLGRTTASTGAIEEITVGSGLSLSAGSLTASGSSGGLLGVNEYTSSGGQTIYTRSSATEADVDATNMAVTFTAPASGNVIVKCSAWCDQGNGDAGHWGLRESTTNIANNALVVRANGQAYTCATFYLTGISAGSHTYKWSYYSNGTDNHRIIVHTGATSNFPPAIMEVYAAP